MTDLVLIDTGCANIASVAHAFLRLGYHPTLSADIDRIARADKLVLPGVGTAPFAMQNLKARGLIEPLQRITQPLLGICLGMQLLGISSSESGQCTKTLGLIDAKTQALQTGNLPRVHMGWNALQFEDHPLFYGIPQGAYVYFVHSFGMDVFDKTLARATYGSEFSAVIGSDNAFGMQFHPEKSGKTGATLLKNFMENIR